ncbi:MAG: hypothetical protein LC789_09035 [Actinobacteria bacterium]|nr:hypothetical protein [Actinomycetota bacterium]MCA1722506.1 hypothetical protein [Actinomycetota bacterium]
MTPSTQAFFSESLQRSADQQQMQMWRAAQTVRAHIAAEDGLDSMLDCLGLVDAQRPDGA